MNIAYAGNKKVFKGILLSLLSIIKHSSDALNVYVVTMDLKDMNPEYSPITVKDCSILEAVVKNKNPQSKVILLDATNIYLNTLSQNKNNDTKYTPYSMIKLYLDEVDRIPDRLIYLDTDTMVLQDLKQIDYLNIEDYELAAARENGKKTLFNSGVLFLNMKLIKQSGLFRRCRQLISSQKLNKPDQDALNKLTISVLYMDGVFNEQAKVRNNTVVRHFCGGMKMGLIPYSAKSWEVEKVRKQFKCSDFDDIYVQYEKINSRFGLDESIMPKSNTI
ncbi:MAG: glycosyltransferase [bacterium]